MLNFPIIKQNSVRIVSLAVSHNRREKTIKALEDLYAQDLPEYVRLEHVLVDDASVDGTAKTVSLRFPEITILKGSGQLFWAGGMRFGWSRIKERSFDYLFVYNDDVRLHTNALNVLVECAQRYTPGIVVGSFSDHTGSVTTYGGQVRENRWHPLRFKRIAPEDCPIEVDTLNMNGALISSSLLKEQGFLSEYFVHSGADFEYGMKIRKAGWVILTAPGYIGTCERNVSAPACSHDASVRGMFRQRHADKRTPMNVHFHFCFAYCGPFWPFFFLSPYVKIIISGLHRRLKVFL